MKNYLKDKSKKYPRFTLVVGKFITHNQHRTNNPSGIYSQCGCEHFKLHWKKEILFRWNQFTHGFNSHKQ